MKLPKQIRPEAITQRSFETSYPQAAAPTTGIAPQGDVRCSWPNIVCDVCNPVTHKKYCTVKGSRMSFWCDC